MRNKTVKTKRSSSSTSKQGDTVNDRTRKVKSTKQGKFHLEFKNAAQRLAFATFQQHDVLFLNGPAGVGKALPISSKLYTKDGIKLMKDLEIGDEIAAPDGNFYPVTGIYPQGFKKINRITFNDGTKIDCCENHLWSVSRTRSVWKENKVVDTNYIYNFYNDNKNYRLSIDCTKPVDFEKKSFYIHPYVMGNLIADGCFRGNNVSFTTIDEEIVDNYRKYIPDDYFVKSQKNNVSYNVIRKQKKNSQNDLKSELIKYNLWNLKSEEKHIPQEYLFCSKDQRIALLQGLMDGDGSVSKQSGMPVFYTTSINLLEDFKLLINSLGGTLKVTEKETKYKNKDGIYIKCKNCFCCHVCLPNEINCFSLSRKLKIVRKRTKYFPKRIISSVEKLNEKVEMQCITIDSPDRLFLVNEFIVTHNTFLAMAFAINELLQGNKKKIILTRPIVEAGEHLGFLPGDFNEKVHPYMLPLYDCITKLVGVDNMQRELVDSSIEVAPLAYLRGRNLEDAVCILDEAQNTTMTQMKLFLTRLGENSKMIINGDPTQSDLPIRPVALTQTIKKLQNVPGIGIITFDSSSIVRHRLVGAMLKELESKPIVESGENDS